MSDLFPSASDFTMHSSMYEPIEDTWGNIAGSSTLIFGDANGFHPTSGSGGGYDQTKDEVFYANT